VLPVKVDCDWPIIPVPEVGVPELWSPLPTLLLFIVAADTGKIPFPSEGLLVPSKDAGLVKESAPVEGTISFVDLVPVEESGPTEASVTEPSSLISVGLTSFSSFKTEFSFNLGLEM